MNKKISVSDAEELVKKVLVKQGYNDLEIQAILKVMIYGALRESSQGINKLFGWHAEKDPTASKPEIVSTSAIIHRCNANKNIGMYANSLAVKMLQKSVSKYGIAAVGVYNFNSSSGAISYYTKELAKKGYVGIMLASADPIGGIAPKGRSVGVFGTNPIAISIPYKSGDITLDMSTAKYTWGDLVNADIKGVKLDKKFAFDGNGKPTSNAKEAMNGTVSSFDGSYKGMGLALMIQILAGGMVGSIYEQSDEKCDYGSLIIAIDVQKFGGRSLMEEQIVKIVTAYKGKKSEGVLLPGEHGDKVYAENFKQKEISITVELLEKIKQYLDKK